MFRSSGGHVLPVGRIVRAVKSEGFNPHVIVTASKNVSVPGVFPRHAGRGSITYDATSVSPDYSVNIRWRIPGLEFRLALVFYLLIPLAVFVLVGFLPFDRSEVLRRILKTLLLSYPVHWIAAAALVWLRLFPAVTQMWFHQRALESARNAFLLDALALVAGYGVMVLHKPYSEKGEGESDAMSEFDPEDDYASERE